MYYKLAHAYPFCLDSVVNWLLHMFMGALKAGVLSLNVLDTPRSWHPVEAEATFGKPRVLTGSTQRLYII